MNQKVINSIKEYLKERKSDNPYLFPSEKSATGKMHPSAGIKFSINILKLLRLITLRTFLCNKYDYFRYSKICNT
jgi:hypothetical protein